MSQLRLTDQWHDQVTRVWHQKPESGGYFTLELCRSWCGILLADETYTHLTMGECRDVMDAVEL